MLNYFYARKINADTELYDYGFRDCSPEIARFTTVDPIRDGRNWYSYVVNDLVNYVDLCGVCGSDGNSKYNPEDSTWYNYTGIGCPYLEPQKEEQSLFSNYNISVAYDSENGAEALYAGIGANLDISNGNFNINANAGVAAYEGSAQISDNPEFNLGISGNASGVAGDSMVGLEGNLVGISADVHIAEIGGTIDITLWGVTI